MSGDLWHDDPEHHERRDDQMFVLRVAILCAGLGAGLIAFVTGIWQLLGISVIAYFLLRGS